MPLEGELTTTLADFPALLRIVHQLEKNVPNGLRCRADDWEVLDIARHPASHLFDPRRTQIADRRLAEHHGLANVGAKPANRQHVADYVGLELVVAHGQVRHVRDV